MFKRILLAVDGSPAIDRSIPVVQHLARIEQAEVLVLHTYELPERYAGYRGYDSLLDQYHIVAKSLVDDAAKQLREANIPVQSEARIGPSAETIIATAAEYDADMIVMGTRGRSNIQEILGSVSAQVLRMARCPVLQVP